MPEQVFHLLQEIARSLGRIEGRQEEFQATFSKHVEEDVAAWAKIDDIIAQHNRIKGAVKVFATLFGVLGGALGAYLAKHF